ncbi:enterochelin esterase-like enzyme [Chitinophaga niastensis]|uniref:Enterochelin esterase-like enzyme n=1 Tax=Chitinophaga niastensis TaxID=536980 RepID=A0A2P8HJS3_CHINA|nr:alpha/beta hydrolase-fold protein [Chitinophaga niastensis]PSL46468.1 enterochelin esterase-like enzyme [Chitinophaga niastensis]
MQTHHHHINSSFLQREVLLDTYFTGEAPSVLLLVNDGQDLAGLLPDTSPSVLVVGIHAGVHRRAEYGTAGVLDHQGYGAMAEGYGRFIIRELLPFLQQQYPAMTFTQHAFAGFSLGGLSALDIVWHHPDIFQLAGVFSGALWWRSKPLGGDYHDDKDRIMHRLIRSGGYRAGLQFFFECGTADETADRNNNGVIDSIDDTKDLIKELVLKGYKPEEDIHYLEIPGGRHDIATWKTAMEVFLQLPFFS